MDSSRCEARLAKPGNCLSLFMSMTMFAPGHLVWDAGLEENGEPEIRDAWLGTAEGIFMVLKGEEEEGTALFFMEVKGLGVFTALF